MPKKSLKTLRRKADEQFSLYIRLRDSEAGYGRCISCNKRLHYKDSHAGHFVRRGVSLLRYDEENVNLQCPRCNTFMDGEQYLYAKALDLKYGEGTADKLMSQRFEIHKFTIGDLEQIISDAKEQIKFITLKL